MPQKQIVKSHHALCRQQKAVQMQIFPEESTRFKALLKIPQPQRSDPTLNAHKNMGFAWIRAIVLNHATIMTLCCGICSF